MSRQNSQRWFRVLMRPIPGYRTAEIGSGYQEVDRIVPISWRSTSKNLGAAQFDVLTYDSENDNAVESFAEYMREVLIVDNRNESEGADNSATSETVLGKILWKGVIRDSSVDIIENRDRSNSDGQGYMVADEFGAALAQKPISYSEETPNFNPFYDGIQFGNYDGDTTGFRDDAFTQRNGPGITWKVYDTTGGFVSYDVETQADILEDRVWNRKKIIEFLVSQESEIDGIAWPWDTEFAALDEELQAKKQRNADRYEGFQDTINRFNTIDTNETNKKKDKILEKYEWFFTYDIPEIENFEGKSIIDALIFLLPEPFDFSFDHNQTDGASGLKIVNKSNVDLPGLCPANGEKVSYNLPNDDVATYNLNLRQEELYDKVIVRGKPILWCGTLTFWNPWTASGEDVLEPAWSDADELIWLRGTILDSEGEPLLNHVDNSTNAAIIRNTLDDVFQKFKWVDSVPKIGTYCGNYSQNERDSADKKFFFGDFYGFDFNAEGDQNILLKDPFITFTTDRTPNKMARTWEPFLPFSRYDEDPQSVSQFQYNLERDRFAEPFLVSVSARSTGLVGEGLQYFIDRSLPFGFASSVEISPWENGFWIKRQNPQTDLSLIDELHNMSLDSGLPSIVPSWALDLETLTNLPFNPALGISAEADNQNEGASSIYRFMLTVSGRSAQRPECFKVRKELKESESGEWTYQNVSAEKTKIVEVPAEIWLAHPNTIRNVASLRYQFTTDTVKDDERGRDNVGNGIIRFYPKEETEGNKEGVHILRDDRDLMLKYLEGYSNWLLEERREASIILAADKPWDLEINDFIYSIKDGNVTDKVESSIASIEVRAEGGPPRVTFKTSVPSIPLISRSLEEAQAAAGARPFVRRDSKPPTLRP